MLPSFLILSLPPSLLCSIKLEDYPYYVCFAYKLPFGHSFSLVFKLREYGYWVSAHLNGEVVFSGVESVGALQDLIFEEEHMIRDDDQ